jgi:hypothetical protein
MAMDREACEIASSIYAPFTCNIIHGLGFDLQGIVIFVLPDADVSAIPLDPIGPNKVPVRIEKKEIPTF